METVSGIPVVDFSAFSIERKTRPNTDSDEVQELARNIFHAFSNVGFVYLKNHGVPQSQIEEILKAMDKFFQLSPAVKSKYRKTNIMALNGWDQVEAQSLNTSMPGDLKESIDIVDINGDWPDEDAPWLKPTVQSYFTQLEFLSRRVLSALATGLNLDPDEFVGFFEHQGGLEGGTALRLNYYPALTTASPVKPGQLRCGEHTDYGAITLLIQDDVGGLEVKTVDGDYVQATPIKDILIVNIGDLMQRWTSDRLKSTYHRVPVPTQEAHRQTARKSVAFFCQPDQSALIKCLDGSDKYPPVKAGDYIAGRANASYGLE